MIFHAALRDAFISARLLYDAPDVYVVGLPAYHVVDCRPRRAHVAAVDSHDARHRLRSFDALILFFARADYHSFAACYVAYFSMSPPF